MQVWVEADNPGEQLKPGASVHVAIIVATIKDATVVPAAAILPGEEGGTAVLTVSGQHRAPKKVEVGVREGDKVQILSGVSPGDQVITVGGIGLDDKAKVRVVDSPARRTRSRDEDEKPDAKEREGREEMSEIATPPPASASRSPKRRTGPHRHGKPIIFVILTLVAVGVYLALTIPVAVFPETDFPRIVVGVDNGVMPIDQMLVTITRPIEEAVNTVQGLDHLWSITSRGTAEVDLFFNWNVDMYRTLELVNAAMARVQPHCRRPPRSPPTA